MNLSGKMPSLGPIKIQVIGRGYSRGSPMLDILINNEGPFVFTKPGIIWIDNDGLRLRNEESGYLDEVFAQEKTKWLK